MTLAYYAIGDIHGRADLLSELLPLIDTDAAGDHYQLVFLGDYGDRGAQTRQVFEILLRLNAEAAVKPVILRGNHDQWFQRALQDDHPRVFERWFAPCNGGQATVRSYDVDPALPADQLIPEFRAAVPESHLQLLRVMRNSFNVPEAFFCHAGVDPMIALDRQSPQILLNGHGSFLDDPHDYGKLVIHGHYSSANFAPVVKANRIGVDTNAVMSGNLTAVRICNQQRPRFVQTCAY